MTVTEGVCDAIIAEGDELRVGMLQKKVVNEIIESNDDVKESAVSTMEELSDGMLQMKVKEINKKIDGNDDVKEPGLSVIRGGILQKKAIYGKTGSNDDGTEAGVSTRDELRVRGPVNLKGEIGQCDPINGKEQAIDVEMFVNAIEAEIEKKNVIVDVNETLIAIRKMFRDEREQRASRKTDIDDVKERESYEAWKLREIARIKKDRINTRAALALREIMDQLKLPQGN